MPIRKLILPLIFGVTGIAILVSLGSWQVRRLAWKEDLIAQLDARLTAPPVDLVSIYKTPDTDDVNYTHVTFDAAFLDGAAFIYAPQPEGLGYRVVKPALWGGASILIDLGWVRDAERGAVFGEKRATLTGHVLFPQDYDPAFTPDPDLDNNIFFARFLPPIAQHLGTTPFMVVATSQHYDEIRPVPVAPTYKNDHREYAITWFSLAVVWLGMTLFWLWSITRATRNKA